MSFKTFVTVVLSLVPTAAIPAAQTITLLKRHYFELRSPAPGNTGLYVGQPGDPRTVGVTMRVTFKGR